VKERPLVIFTILASMAAGAFLLLGLVYWQMTRLAGAAAADRLADRGLLFIGPLLLLSLIASLFHLGSPQNAWLALSNLRRSWLSREALFALLFTGLGGAFALTQWLRLSGAPARALLAGLAALSGLALIYCMGRIYMLRTAPAWNSWLTLASFFTTAILLGGLAVGAFLAFEAVFDLFEPVLLITAAFRWIGGLIILLLWIEFILIPLSFVRFANQNVAVRSGRPLSQIYIFRLAPLFLGTTLAGVVFFASPPLNFPAALAALLALGLALFSETFGRILFYEMRQPLM
jgi:anaerobic dimethyl sulfoxide reductase subunit C